MKGIIVFVNVMFFVLILWVGFASSKPVVESFNGLSFGVPFSASPPCTEQFEQLVFAFSFLGSSASNFSLSGIAAAVPNWPGAGAGLRVVCMEGRLNDGTIVELESAGPRATTSRIFNENHPTRKGGFLVDNILEANPPFLTSYGLLFKNLGRYDEKNPPKSDDGPAPGPGKCGGFELNIFWDGENYRAQRFNGDTQAYDVDSVGIFSLSAVHHANASSSCPLQMLQKEMIDITFRRGDDILVAGSLAAVKGLKGAPPLGKLVIAGNLNLVESVAQGGPRAFNLVPIGPNQQYSPLYYWTFNGFWFFNNLVFDKEPLIDTSGLIFTSGSGSFELNLFFQNEKGITCDGSTNPPTCREVKDGSGYALWIYEQKKDKLHEKTFGNVVLTPRRTCSVSHPLELKQEEPVAEKPKTVEIQESSSSSSYLAVCFAIFAVVATTVWLWCSKDSAKTVESKLKQ